MRIWKICRDDRGYTLIELAAVLALTALTATVAGSLILAGTQRGEQMEQLHYREELLARIQEQMVSILTYCDELYITNREYGEINEENPRRQMLTGMQTLVIDKDGFLSLNGVEIFGASHFGACRFNCQVEIGEQSLTLDLSLTQNGEEVGRTQAFVRLYNMELLERGIKAASEHCDNREGGIVFYIGVPLEEDI